MRTGAVVAVVCLVLVSAGVAIALGTGALGGSGTPTPAAAPGTPSPAGTPLSTQPPTTPPTAATPTAAAPTPTPRTDATGTSATATPGPAFDFSVDDLAECGETCRDVEATLTNNQDETATDVTVDIRMYAGNGTGGERVWEGTESVGRLAAGESATITRRVELSTADAIAVQQADGWVTVEATVESNGTAVTLTRRHDAS